MTMRCPHTEARFCPLYHGAHVGGFGCIDGGEEGFGGAGCAVERGARDYGRELARLWAAHPAVVEDAAGYEFGEQRRAQRERNMRLNGIHP